MNKINTLCLLLMLFSIQAFAQKFPKNEKKAIFAPKKIEFMKGKEIVCPVSHLNQPSYVPPPASYLTQKNARTSAGATFEVTYFGFTPEAKAAFQRAVDIWASLLTSTVPIKVEAYWTKQDRTTLGSASASDYTRNFQGQPKDNVWYPIALAEKIAGKHLNAPSAYDIQAKFNSNINWSFSGTPASGQYDLTTVVLHELCHGLGFAGSWFNQEGKVLWGYGTQSPFSYDTFIENIGGQKLADSTNFPNNSTALFTQCTSDNIFFNGPVTKSKLTDKPKIYAPTEYQSGSSMSHLDDKQYPSGNEHALMTSSVSPQEVNHNPGSIVLSIFDDIGWKGTSIIHEALGYFSENLKQVKVQATIRTDNTLKANSTMVYYTENDTLISNAKPVLMNKVGTDLYEATIPIVKDGAIIRYYIIAEDQYSQVTAPSEAPSKGYYGFVVGLTDTYPPTAFIDVPLFLKSSQTFNVQAIAYDSHEAGIAKVSLEYSVNGAATKTVDIPKFDITRDGTANSLGRYDAAMYFLKSPWGTLKNGDRVKYRIMANDVAGNTTYAPSYYDAEKSLTSTVSDYYEFVVSDLVSTIPVSQYSNNFDNPTTDFANVGFSIVKPANFESSALHSIHPYKNGGNIDFQSNLVSTLMLPITISSNKDSANIEFDEVVLVEPGEKGIAYGESGFYDYAVVEGSKDAGKSWTEFADGYDANSNSSWLSAFMSELKESKITVGNQTLTVVDSKATGSSKLYKHKKINMLTNGEFASGDAVLVRFRLFSDELTTAWGWAIDNLQIQVPPVVITAIEPLNHATFEVYPNPSTEELSLRIEVPQNSQTALLTFINAQGNKLIEQEYEVNGGVFSKTINISAMPDGLYFVKLKTEKSEIVRKFVVKH